MMSKLEEDEGRKGEREIGLRGARLDALRVAFSLFLPVSLSPLFAANLLLAALLPSSTAPAAEPDRARVVETAQSKIVKVYGAGGYHGLEGYQSGFLISPDGHILTALSYVLDTDHVTVTLGDGRRYEARMLGGDPRLEIAVLKIDAAQLPCFDLEKAVKLTAGTRIYALSNLFNVAMGDEQASVQSGAVSVVTKLEGRRGVFETPYHGPIYVLDVTTNNPGAAGGALVNHRGELAGILGKELRNSLNNTWLNYAVPIDQVRHSVDDIKAGKFIAVHELPAEKKPAHPMDAGILGINLVPDVLERTPAYVDQVRPHADSPSAWIRKEAKRYLAKYDANPS